MEKTHRYINVVIICLSLVSLVQYIRYSVPYLGRTEFDDAFMVTRYAKHWLAGEGFSWNVVDGSAYGVTSPAYLFMITLILWTTRGPDGVVLTYTSYIVGLLSLLALTWSGFLVQKNKSSGKSLLPLLVIPYVIYLTPFTYHSLTGMETTLSLLANALLACGIVLFVRKQSIFTFLFCLFSGIFAFITRPDNGLYAFLLPPLLLFVHEKSRWRHSLAYILLFALAVGIILIMNKFIFNDFLPLPFYAKANGFLKGYIGKYKWNAMQYMLDTFLTWLPCLVLVVATLSKKVCWKVAIIFSTIAATFAYYSTVTQVMGYQARYYYPALAFVLLAANEALAGRVEIQTSRASTNAFRRRLIIMGVFLLPSLSVFTFGKQIVSLWDIYIIGIPETYHSITQYRNGSTHPLPSLGWESIPAMGEMLRFVPRETVLAASEYGWISSQYPDMRIIDLVGLHDRNIAHGGFSVAYVMSQEPDLIWFPPSDYTYEIAQLLDNDKFIRDYEYYPEAWNHGIALKNSSVHFTELKCSIEKEFSRVYPGLQMSDYLAQPIVGQ